MLSLVPLLPCSWSQLQFSGGVLMKMLSLLVAFVLLLALGCSAGLSESEVKQMIEDATIAGPQGEPWAGRHSRFYRAQGRPR